MRPPGQAASPSHVSRPEDAGETAAGAPAPAGGIYCRLG